MLFEFNKPIFALVFVFLIFLLFVFFAFFFNLSISFVVAAFFVFLVFYALKSFAFSFICSSEKKPFSFFESVRIFFISDFVELITFSGKLGADAAKVFFLKKKFGWKGSLWFVFLFRLSVFVSFIFSVLFFIDFSFFVVFLVLLLFAGFWLKRFVVSCFFNLAADFCRIILFALLLFEFNLPVSREILLAFLFAGFFGRVFSFIPHGLIIQDIILGSAVLEKASVVNSFLINLVLRCVSVVPSIIIGAFLISKDVLDKIKSIMQRKKPLSFNFRDFFK